MTVRRQPHFLRRNEASRYPRRLLVIDTEARTRLDEGRELHSFRLGAGSYDVIDPATRQPVKTERADFATPAELWQWVDDRTKAKGRTVVFAHNLGYDLRLADGLTHLPALGWKLTAFSIDSYRVWLQWKRGNRSLLLIDTMSFVGRGLAAFNRLDGVTKAPLPKWGDGDDAWAARCRADVELLRAVVLRLLEWLQDIDAGNFRMTGPAQGSALFRHRFLEPRSLLIHDEADVLAAERRAAWTGRCEVWRHGLVKGPLFEYDYSLAYARVARDAMLPTRLRGAVGPISLARFDRTTRSLRGLFEVDVETDVPVVPTEAEGRILWPTGRFRSTLWDCEIRLALDAGARVTIRRGWLYSTSPLLKTWAEWIIGRLDGPDPEACPVARAVLKAWSRSLIGRFALRYPQWVEAGTSAESDLRLLPFVDGDTGEAGQYLRLGTQLMLQEGIEEAPDSAPAVTSYIMALSRCRLWRAMQACPPGSLVYVDTDSLMVTADGVDALDEVAGLPEHEGLRVKGTYRRARLWSPRQVELDREIRIAGVRKDAARKGPRTFETEVWEGTAESVRRGRPGEVVVRRRRVSIRGRDYRREHGPGGSTFPRALDEPGDVDERAAGCATA